MKRLFFVILLLVPAVVSGQHHGHAPAKTPAPPVTLATGLGDINHPVTTNNPEAQKFFNQGLAYVYAFNHAEAVRSFKQAAQLDPNLAMAYWGIALSLGSNYNVPADGPALVEAYSNLQKAIALAPKASEHDRAYISALSKRYSSDINADKRKLEVDYKNAMGELARNYPDDLDAATLYAESMMNLRPWQLWTLDGKPAEDTLEIVSVLEGVLRRDPNHSGANHYYIHAVEAVNPQAAVPCAERLARLMPGEGHMVHMPAHIYIRVGRWNDAVQANQHAIHNDEVFIEGQHPTGVYPLAYYPHNIHFLAFASTMAGRSMQAIEASTTLTSKVNLDAARQVGMLQEMLPYRALTLTTFGKWDEVLAEPLPPADLRFSYAMAHYARGVAQAAKARWAEAQAALDTVTAINAATSEGADGKTALSIAVSALSGEIATRRGDLEAGINYFREAAKIEDAGLYFEPPKWYYPIRHSLGAALLKAGQHAEAEKVYREDLRRFPENGWSLFGLAQALRAQGKNTEAAEVESRFSRVWSSTDVTLTASRF